MLAIAAITNTTGVNKPVMQGESREGNSVIVAGSSTAPFATLQLYVNGYQLATITADSQGNWTYNAMPEEGQNSITVGSRGEFSKPYIINVSTAVAPEHPVEAAPAMEASAEPEPVSPVSLKLAISGITNAEGEQRSVLQGKTRTVTA